MRRTEGRRQLEQLFAQEREQAAERRVREGWVAEPGAPGESAQSVSERDR